MDGWRIFMPSEKRVLTRVICACRPCLRAAVAPEVSQVLRAASHNQKFQKFVPFKHRWVFPGSGRVGLS